MGGMHAQDPLPKKEAVMKNPARVVVVSFPQLHFPTSNLIFTIVSTEGSTDVCKATNGKTCLTRSQVCTYTAILLFWHCIWATHNLVISQVEDIAGNLFDDWYGNSQATCFTSYGGHCLTKLKKKNNGSIRYQYGNCNPTDAGCN